MKAIPIKRGWMIRCAACETHIVPATWTFSGDTEQPTFTPSVRVTQGFSRPAYCCHFIVTDGKIQYCGDCSHDLKGQTLDMLEFTPEQIEQYNQPGYQE